MQCSKDSDGPAPFLAVVLMVWIGLVLLLDHAALPSDVVGGEALRQVLLGAATWAVLLAVLRRQSPLVRAQTAVVVALATLVEYTFSPLLEAYTYRIGTVPLFVPPGHGLVYLAAAALGRSSWVRTHLRAAVVTTAVVGGAWALAALLGWGAVGGGTRHDVLGAFWYLCLLGFLIWGPNDGLYVGAFVVVSLLELSGTSLGTWSWATRDPVLGVIGQGNPPSGSAGGYGWFDLYAVLAAPHLLRWWARLVPVRSRSAKDGSAKDGSARNGSTRDEAPQRASI